MEILQILIAMVIVVTTTWTCKVLNWVWFRPKKIEKHLRQQGFSGNSYRLLFGDIREYESMAKEAAETKSITTSNDLVPKIFPYYHNAIKNYGKDCYVWMGPTARILITNPEHLKEIFTKHNIFLKQKLNPVINFVLGGLVTHRGEKWAKHRKILNPVFRLDYLESLAPTFHQVGDEMISKWEKLVSLNKGSCEIDVWPDLQNYASDAISRTAFGSSYEKGRRVFELLKQQGLLLIQSDSTLHLPGWRFVPTKTNMKLKKNDKEITRLLMHVVQDRIDLIKNGNTIDDLLGALVESNLKEIDEHGRKSDVGLSVDDIIQECKLLYTAGLDTTSMLLVWTLVLLCLHPDWQVRAREEVLRIFGTNDININGINDLKVVNMILHEVLRLYPPVAAVPRDIEKDIKLGDKVSLPAGVQVLLPFVIVHHDPLLWGNDAMEFKPERFSEGVSKATNGRFSFFPFGWGSRVCIGQNFAMIEAKLALSMILQRFAFELSPNYVHFPFMAATLQPKLGAKLILRKL